MTNFVAVKALNAERWARCTIVPKRQAEVDAVARKLCAPDAKLRYCAISQAVWGKLVVYVFGATILLAYLCRCVRLLAVSVKDHPVKP
jgi:hypothetical protein